ncbi:MAG TPA: FtsX-like permease family protein, partial [Puia sp.]|nr:FtsX-like permease family protein [Puia sp.]
RLEQEKGVIVRLGLQRFGDRYLHDTFVNGNPEAGRIAYVRLFSGIAVFILLIACINFMNLATARSVARAREIGLRKVVGSMRGPLIAQFFCEALVFAVLSLSLSLIIVVAFLPFFNTFTGKQLSLPFTQPTFWAYAAVLVLVTGLVAGSYPALYLSSLKPIRILKGAVRFSAGAIRFRRSLTVFQFVLSIALIIATLVITRQVSYVQNTRLGYDRENLIYVRIEGDLVNQKNYLLFKQLASTMPGIALVDRCTEALQNMDFIVSDSSIRWEGKRPDEQVGIKPASVGWDFVRLMKMEVVLGRDFSRTMATDSADAFLVNEEAVREMGLKDPIGKWVSAWKKKGHIIGVLKDFHTASLHEPIMPVLLDVKEYEDFGLIVTRTKPGQTNAALASLESVYKTVNPGYAFSYQFVDEEYKKLYNSELIISRLTVSFAILAILISCLGLLGLAMLAARQRIREIGIRKVLGASVRQIVGLFSRDFLGLIAVAFLIAAPLAGYAMQRWLADFAYRIDISWWVFALAGFSAALLALLTVGWQAIQAARVNPATSLRTE